MWYNTGDFSETAKAIGFSLLQIFGSKSSGCYFDTNSKSKCYSQCRTCNELHDYEPLAPVCLALGNTALFCQQ